MDEIKQTEKLAASQVQVVWERIRSGLGGGVVMSEELGVPVIVVVDDDESVRQSLAGFIESVGYEVALFSSAEEFVRSGCHRDDLRRLILDVRLPGMSGFELYSQLTLSGRSIPAIFITAHKDPSVAAWATKPGVVKLLYKTVSAWNPVGSRSKRASVATLRSAVGKSRFELEVTYVYCRYRAHSLRSCAEPDDVQPDAAGFPY
jgi:CheY-like chemotaxis protein